MQQHVPELGVQVLRLGDAHVVGHHVDDDAEAVLVGRGGQGFEACPAAEVVGDPAVVDDVVAVHGSGRGLQHGGEVQVRDAELGQVRERPLGRPRT